MGEFESGDSGEYRDSAEEAEAVQREAMKFLKDLMAKHREENSHMRPPTPIGHGAYLAVAAPQVNLRRIDNGWIISYWAGTQFEFYSKAEDVAALVQNAVNDVEKFEREKPTAPTGLGPHDSAF